MRRGLLVAALAAGIASALEIFALGALAPLEDRVIDAFVRMHALGQQPDQDIVLVDIDEQTLVRMQDLAGRWPWPRAVHGELIDGIAAQQPRAIVFDILFSEPDRFRPESDRAFVESVAAQRNVYFPMVKLDPRDDPNGPLARDVAQALGLHARAGADPQARIAAVPPQVLPESLWRTGTINFREDPDGVGRRYALRTVVGGWEIPSLPARVARDLGYAVPDSDDLLLAWRGPAGAFRHVPYADLYEDFNRSRRVRAQDEFRGRIVIVGTSAAGMKDLRVTPIASLHPGAEILATALDNLKNGRAMTVAPRPAPLFIALLLLALVLEQFRRNVTATRAGLVLAAASGAVLALGWWSAGRLMRLGVLAPLAGAWAYYAYAALGEYLRERRAREQAVAQFSRFVNPLVVQALIERGGLPSGQSRDVTLLFSDIRGFTTLSETRTPEEVVEILNRYFSLQVDVIFRHGGTLDKFIGDAIMAVWGAPLDDPHHARHAVACALDMADTLLAFRDELGELGTSFDVGIGVHSGPAVVGLIGSDRRREYTAIGDTVNLASRIEGLTKDAHRRILVSEDTMRACSDLFDFDPCGSYKVKGRAQEVALFEPRRKSS